MRRFRATCWTQAYVNTGITLRIYFRRRWWQREGKMTGWSTELTDAPV